MKDDISGYTFDDLVDAGIVRSRTDLARKQKETGFPLPVKLSTRQMWFPKAEVQRWLAKRIAERPAATHKPIDAPKQKPVTRRTALSHSQDQAGALKSPPQRRRSGFSLPGRDAAATVGYLHRFRRVMWRGYFAARSHAQIDGRGGERSLRAALHSVS
jgi:predicted DNA-binding transcriptional regulator AlpA